MTKTCGTCRYSTPNEHVLLPLDCNVGDITPPQRVSPQNDCPEWKIKPHLSVPVRFATTQGD